MFQLITTLSEVSEFAERMRVSLCRLFLYLPDYKSNIMYEPPAELKQLTSAAAQSLGIHCWLTDWHLQSHSHSQFCFDKKYPYLSAFDVLVKSSLYENIREIVTKKRSSHISECFDEGIMDF